jgi:hypothetical protein
MYDTERINIAKNSTSDVFRPMNSLKLMNGMENINK